MRFTVKAIGNCYRQPPSATNQDVGQWTFTPNLLWPWILFSFKLTSSPLCHHRSATFLSLFNTMPAGNGPGFPNDRKTWIMEHMPEYLAKTAYGKPTVPGQPRPEDDSDLANWVRLCRDEFELTFKDALEADIAAQITTAKDIRSVRLFFLTSNSP